VLERALTLTLPLGVLEEYAAAQSIPARQLAPASETHGPAPIFLRDDDLCDISGYEGLAPSPEVNLFELSDVTVIGRTEFVLAGGRALHPKVINPTMDAFMMELENRGKVDLDSGTVSIFPRAAILREPKAISLLGQCNGNYAHWVTEVLARFILVDEIPEFKGWPLLVDCPVHEKLLDALDFLNVSRRRIIEVRQYQRVQVERLIYITPPSMTPPDTREFFKTGKLAPPRVEQFHFSKPVLAKLCERAGDMARDCLPAAGTEDFDFESQFVGRKKIFLQRAAWSTGNGRLLRNADSVEAVLAELGFQGIQIADYSFEGQALTAQESGIVVSPIGAALSNLVFRKPGCVVVILSPHYEAATFYYFANLMAALGHHAIFVLGPQTRHGGANIYNRDFRISIRLLRQAVRKALEIEHDQRIRKRPSSNVVPVLRVVGE
jgi:capsular polysaccharide biosynthesis protein